MVTVCCAGLYWDAEAALDFLLMRRDIDRRKIILFGRSLGGAVAIYLAALHSHVDKLVMSPSLLDNIVIQKVWNIGMP